MEPRPVAQIVTRRHPLAFALYLTVLIMGVIFVFHWFGTHQTTEALFPGIPWWVIFAWKWEMLLGGALAAGSLTASPRSGPGWPDLADLLHLEGIGALTCAFGLATYAAAVESLVGFDKAAPAISLYIVLVLGLVTRGIQAFREARRLERMVTALTVEEDRPHE